MTIEEAQTLSELRDLLIKVQPLIERVSRLPNRLDGATDDEPVCIPLNNGIAAHMIGTEDGTLGILFVRADQARRGRPALTSAAHAR